MKRKSKSFSTLLVLSLIATLFINNSFANTFVPATTKELPNIDQLRTCFSDKNASLDVMFLMDISKSMQQTDKRSQRKEMVKGTIELLSSLAEDDKKVFISFATFGHALYNDNKVRMDWLSLSNSKSEILSVAENWSINKNALAKGTDWKGGLQVVSNAINARQMNAKAQNKTSCPVLIWMTDGQIDPEDHNDQMSPADIESFAQICEDDNALIDSLKGTTILGALLSKPLNELSNESPKKKSVFLFQSVIEGSVDSLPLDVFEAFKLSGIGQTYTCGNPPNAGRGKLIQEKTSTALAWEFVDLVATLADLIRINPKSESDEKVTFRIDSSLARVVVYVKRNEDSSGLTVKDVNGKVICERFSCEKTSQSNSVMNVYEIKIPEGSDVGDWTFETNGSEAKYFGSLVGGVAARNIDIAISNTNFAEGINARNSTSFTIKYENGDPFRKNDFSDITIEIVAPTSNPATGNIDNDSFDTELIPTPNDKSVRVLVHLRSEALGTDFVVSKAFDIKVMNLGLYPSLDCGGGSSCKLADIPNESKPSINSLKFKGATKQDTYVRLKSIEFTNDDNGRLSGYSFDFLGESNEWTAVPVNGTLELPVEIRNSESGTSCGAGTLIYEVQDANQNVLPPISQAVSICTVRDKNWLAIIGFYILFVLIGVGLPYLYLLYDTRKAAVFTTERYRYLKTPMLVTEAGKVLVPSNQESEYGSSDWSEFTLPDYKEVSRGVEIENGTREISVGPVQIEVIPPKWNPFAQPVVNISGNSLLLYSNSGSSAKEVKKGMTSAAVDISRLQFITMLDSVISPVSKQSLVEKDFDEILESSSVVQNSVEPATGDVEGTMFILLPGMGELGKLLSRATEEIVATNWESFMTQIQTLRATEAEIAAAKIQIEPDASPGSIGDDELHGQQPKVRGTDFDDDWDSVGDQSPQIEKTVNKETPSWKNEFDD